MADKRSVPHPLGDSQHYTNEPSRYTNLSQPAPYEYDNLNYSHHEYSEPSFSGRYDYPSFPPPGPITGQPGKVQPMEFNISKTTTPDQRSQPTARQWSTGIWDCFKNRRTCCILAWCAPCYLCNLSDKLGDSCCLPLVIPCGFYSLIPLRTKIRTENNIDGSICEDCCMACWCPFCTMSQMSLEQDFVKQNLNTK